MAIATVQVSPVVVATSSAAASTSFGSLPAASALIRVAVAMTANLGSEDVTVADNQGNTYTQATDSGNVNDLRVQLWYTYNIGAPSGTFTVTATALGTNQATIIQAKEASGFGAVDPLAGIATATGNSNTAAAGPTGLMAEAEVLLDAVVGSYQTITAVQVVSPTWDVDGTFSGFETDSRIVTNMSAQSVSWSLGGSAVWATGLAGFAAVPDDSDARMTQSARQVLWQDDDATNVQITQMARQVLYPFTCEPGPGPTTVHFYIRRLRQWLLPSSDDNKNVQIPTIEILMRTGIGLTPGPESDPPVLGSDPMVMWQLSKDGGKTWLPERWIPAGQIGRYKDRVRILRATGNYRNAVGRIVVTDPVTWEFVAALGDPREGSS